MRAPLLHEDKELPTTWHEAFSNVWAERPFRMDEVIMPIYFGDLHPTRQEAARAIASRSYFIAYRIRIIPKPMFWERRQ